MIGLLDDVVDGDVAYDIVFEFAHSPFATPPARAYLHSTPAAVFSTHNADVRNASITGWANLTVTLASGSATQTTPEGGAVTLLARLTREPQPGSSVVFAVSTSAPRAATVRPGPAILAFDAANWDIGTPLVISGVPYATPSLGNTGGRSTTAVEERTGHWPRDLDDDTVGGAAVDVTAFAAPLDYTVAFALIWTDDPFYRAVTPQRAATGLLSATDGLGTGDALGALEFVSFPMTHAAALNATRNVTLSWVGTEYNATSDEGITVASSHEAFITRGGGEATLFARLSHAPAPGAIVVLAVSATFRDRVGRALDSSACGDEIDQRRRRRMQKHRTRRRTTVSRIDTYQLGGAFNDGDTTEDFLPWWSRSVDSSVKRLPHHIATTVNDGQRILAANDDNSSKASNGGNSNNGNGTNSDNADDDDAFTYDDDDDDEDDDDEDSSCLLVNTITAVPNARAAVVLWPAVVVFTSDDWDVDQPIKLKGLDDGSGTLQHNVTAADVILARVGGSTGDLAYDALLPPVTRIAIARRDTPPWQLLVEVAAGYSAATSEAGNTVELVARLSAPPPAGVVVAFLVTVDDQTEGIVTQPVDISFSDANWNLNTTITVAGVADDVTDGDILYHVEFLPEPGARGVERGAGVASADAYSGVLGARVPILNRDTYKNRVGVLLASATRDDAEHSGGVCNILQQRNTSTCALRWALCYPDETTQKCSAPLTYNQLFYAGITSVHVDVWLESHSTPTPVDGAHTAASFDLLLGNASSHADFLNPYFNPDDDGYHPTTLDVKSDTAGYPSEAYPDIAYTIVSDTDNLYEIDGAYSNRLTFRGRDDHVVRGDHNVTVKFAAYLYEGDVRFPTEGYMPESKYYIVEPALPTSVGGPGPPDGVTTEYINTNQFNVTLEEVDYASFVVHGCGHCITSEKGTTCELRISLSAIPQHPVYFDAAIRQTVDSINNYSPRYEGSIYDEDNDKYVYEHQFVIQPSEWKDGIVVVLKGVDDSLYEVRDYVGGKVPYNVTFHDHFSADAEWAAIAPVHCTAYNTDDETGGFIVTQNGGTPKSTTSGKIVTSVDESGNFGVAHVEMNEPPSSEVWLPVYATYGYVNITGPTMLPCPFAALAIATASDDTRSGSYSGDAWENVSTTSQCLYFKAGARQKQQPIVYTGIDDGGTQGTHDPGGLSSFKIEFGPSYSDDSLFNHLHDSVRGSVVDNDVMTQSLHSCNTTERANHTAAGASPAAVHHTHACVVEIGYDAAYFNGSHDADLESSAVEFAVVVSAETDEGVFALAVSDESRGVMVKDNPVVRVNNSYGGNGWRGGIDAYSKVNASTAKRASFIGGGKVTVTVNGTDDDLDDGDITYVLKLETFVRYEAHRDVAFAPNKTHVRARGGWLRCKTFFVNITNFDDDTAGVRIVQYAPTAQIAVMAMITMTGTTCANFTRDLAAEAALVQGIVRSTPQIATEHVGIASCEDVASISSAADDTNYWSEEPSRHRDRHRHHRRILSSGGGRSSPTSAPSTYSWLANATNVASNGSYSPTTMLPAALPSMLPTASPSMLPTALPTWVPTALPTWVPTASPTVNTSGNSTIANKTAPTPAPTAPRVSGVMITFDITIEQSSAFFLEGADFLHFMADAFDDAFTSGNLTRATVAAAQDMNATLFLTPRGAPERRGENISDGLPAEIVGVAVTTTAAGLPTVLDSGDAEYSQVSYKVSARDESDYQYEKYGHETPPATVLIELEYNETSEWGDNATFALSLTSQPTHPVIATVMPVILSPHPHGGGPRYEGAPVGFGSTYDIIKTENDEEYVQGSTDSLASGGLMEIEFTPTDWAEPRFVMIQGMDDWVNDYNTTYYIGVVFASRDQNYFTPPDAADEVTNGAYAADYRYYSDTGWSEYDGHGPAITLPFTNTDNDTIGLVVEGSSKPGICSEPYYGCVAPLSFATPPY